MEQLCHPTLSNVQLVDDNGTYRAIVSNSAGSITSNSAKLSVNAPVVAPTITTHPIDRSATVIGRTYSRSQRR